MQKISFFCAVNVLFLIVMFSANVNAQLNQTQLYQHGNVLNKTSLSGAELNDENNFIQAGQALVIRAQVYNKTNSPVIVVASFTDINGDQSLSYPVALIDKNKNDTNLTIYGPLFYDGRETMNVQIETYQLKQEFFNSIKGEYDKHKDLLELIPAVSQFSSFIDLGWQVAAKFYKNKLTSNSISIKRDGTLPLKTPNLWYILCTNDAQQKLTPILSQNITLNNEFPNLDQINKGVTLILNVKSSSRETALQTIKERIDRFLKVSQKHLDDNGLSFENPFNSTGQIAFLSQNQYIETYLSENEVKKTAVVSRDSFLKLLDRLNNDFGSDTAADKNNAVFFSQRFSYNGDPAVGENGFDSIKTWYNWIKIRCNGVDNSVSEDSGFTVNSITCKDTATFTFSAFDPTNRKAKLVKVTDKFANDYLKNGLTLVTVDKSDPITKQFTQYKANTDKLSVLINEVFHPTPEKPWMKYEQKIVANWMTANIPQFNKLAAQITVEKDPDKVSKMFTDLLTDDSFLISESNAGAVSYTLKSKGEYIADLYISKLIDIAKSDSQNKYKDMKSSYNKIIGFASKQSILSASETKKMNDKLKIFPAINSTELKPETSDKYFDSTILTVSVDGNNNPVINEVPSAQIDLKAISDAEAIFNSTKDSEARQYTSGSVDLIKIRKSTLVGIIRRVDIAKDSALNDLLIGYVSDKILDDGLSQLVKAPSKNYQAIKDEVGDSSSSDGILGQQNSQLVWDSINRRFDNMGNSNQVLKLRKNLEFGCSGVDRADKTATKQCGEPTHNGIVASANIKQLYDIFCLPTTSTLTRTAAAKVISDYVLIPQESLTGKTNDEQCTIYKTQFPSDKLFWVDGIFQLKPDPPAVTPVTIP